MYKAVRARLRALVCGKRRGRGDAGMVTSEYATGIVAVVGFAVLLYQVLTSDSVRALLEGIVKKALSGQM
ncbi:DUF4244 domain-containing protein [Streptomyces sp. Amel2xC10]|uniref:DUF4244 domain-containing protein n=1 Tax=Streptomyces sp. Amel2xC10 TaxID=1305826 RepID=UPI000A090182|nr:DUF4244 domain-containing protein [Streptomyces sp. Amel2xC10]SMF70892.1 Protein of unknown function [Streptomyces sp. Amel2xC10]